MKNDTKKIITAEAARISPARQPEDYVMTKTELAAALRLSPRTVAKLMKERSIPHIKIGKGPKGDVRFIFRQVIEKLNDRFGVCADS